MRFCVLALVGLAACGQNLGFGVGLTINADDSVSEAALASMRTLVITASDDEHGTFDEPLPKGLARQEEIIYRAEMSSRTLTLAVSTLDATGALVAFGQTAKFSLAPKGLTFEGVVLSLGAPADMAMGQDGGDAAVSDGAEPVDMTPSGPSIPGEVSISNQATNSTSFSWAAATAGASPIDHYKIYRNGTAYTTVTGTSYVDSAATNANESPTFTKPATAYAYWISAVDTDGREGPIQKRMVAQVYLNGTDYWDETKDQSYSDTVDYADTTDMPGMTVIHMHVTQQYGAFVPVSSGTLSPMNDLELGAFDHLSFELSSDPSDPLSLFGDVQFGSMSTAGQAGTNWNPPLYGPVPQIGAFGTYDIPLSVIGIGTASFTGSITNGVLTVTNLSAGSVTPSPGGWVMGANVTAGTYITTANKDGTFTVSPSQTVAAEAMTMQRTHLEAFALQELSTTVPRDLYLNDVKFTAN